MKKLDPKYQEYQHVTMHFVMSGDLSTSNVLFGGRLVRWVDEAVAMYCMEAMETHLIVTKKITEVIFNKPSKLTDILEIQVKTIALGKSSITMKSRVIRKKVSHDEQDEQILECELVFVAIDEQGKTVPHGFEF